jgi:hypothetical protein
MFAFHLIKDFIFAKGQDGHKRSTGFHSNLDKPKPFLQGEIEFTWIRKQGFGSTSHHDSNRPSRILQNVFTRAFGDRAHPQGQQVVAVQRHLEVGLKGQQISFDTREMMAKSIGFGTKCNDSTVGKDTMRMIPIIGRGNVNATLDWQK